MSLSDFLRYFPEVTVCYVRQGWAHQFAHGLPLSGLSGLLKSRQGYLHPLDSRWDTKSVCPLRQRPLSR
jgi:hypothetical protein